MQRRLSNINFFGKSRIVIFSMSIFLVITSCKNEKYTEYRPHFFLNENKYYGSPELEKEELKNIIQVLEFYGEDYKLVDSSKVLITKELNKNWDLLWNYTTKSNDKDWLETHKPDLVASTGPISILSIFLSFY